MNGPGGLLRRPEAALRLVRVTKTFPATRALDQVSLEVRAGEIHGLVGGNGSGKSTLIKVLAGVERADRGGLVEVHGRTVETARMRPAAARRLGLRFVHQQRTTFPGLTVLENLSIGRGFETNGRTQIRWRSARNRALRVLEQFAIDAGPECPIEALGPAAQAMVAIARVLQDAGEHGQALVLDEPTASLPPKESSLVLAAIRRHAQAGGEVLLASHRLHEVLGVCDRVGVLRDGRLVATVDSHGAGEKTLAGLIAGRDVPLLAPRPPSVRSKDVALEARGLSGGLLRSATFAVHRGEVLGIAGLEGSGCSALLELLFGARPVEGGEILMDGRVRSTITPAAAIRHGVAYVPGDRSGRGIFADMSVRENLFAVRDHRRCVRVRHRGERVETRRLIESFAIVVPSDEAPLNILSGGNQQKVVLARWLRRRPRVLVLDDPTRGVDIAARNDIHALLRNAVDAGASALVASSDLAELAFVADRVLILAEGRIEAELHGPELHTESLSRLVGGDAARAA